ncbi:hypothetical protein Lser_V15G17652 [Lactuca serriola]
MGSDRKSKKKGSPAESSSEDGGKNKRRRSSETKSDKKERDSDRKHKSHKSSSTKGMNGFQTHVDDTENLKTHRSILVGNIHVLFNPSRGDIKLGQVRLFLAKAHRLLETWGNIPIILGGDFNSMPQFIASSELNIQHHERKKIYATRLTRDEYGEPLATSFHSRFIGTVDYI